MLLLQATDSKRYRACLIAAIVITLNVLGGHFRIASLIKCDFSYLWYIMEHAEVVEGPEDEISRTEIEKAVKQMRNNKAPGPSGITAERIKALDKLGVDWLHTILNEFLIDEQIPGDLKESEIVTIYKQKGDALECGNYRGIKLLEIALKVYERVIERRIRERVHIHSNQFGFMPGRGLSLIHISEPTRPY